ncbi:hypothetical protein OPKNFCMD_6737 [Methylobacterium crusticola]|uniref:Biliverdin-producing heme oxygenase n=1 Tax=Methylobacterium crusticola TaxID=1697972 RepID=A0ABQ4R978_9HYPH|nr:biliverdin-producing heme oxygenase [Methylobacterium crusticola]GJD53957.1 hypothetical protein OPKNFCMD_6737 [Methylobacterium crusticola]
MSAILARLRDETREAHARIERDLDWERRIATRAGYRALLARFWGFHAAWEPALARALHDEAFLAPRRRLAHLEDDLARLGLAPEAVRALPRPGGPLPRTRPEALGSLYVLEGSTLGGQVVARAVERRLDLRDGEACRYYRSHGRDTGAMWTAFRARLEAEARARPAEVPAILAGAEATFVAMAEWLCADAIPA